MMPGAEQLLLLMEKGSPSSSSPPAAAAATPATPATPATLDPADPSDKSRASAGHGGGSEPHRKSSKPIMEKRRRARINESLAQLKTLILDALKKDSSRHSKLEKADILEMTVKHLRSLQRAQVAAVLNTDPTVLVKYRAGFNECVNEVTRFLSTCEGVTAEVRTRLLSHLGSCMSQINAMNYPTPPPAPGASFGQALVQIPAGPAAPAPPAPPTGSVAPCKPSGNPAAPAETPKVYGGFQLVPASDGQFAFLIPNAAFAPHGNAVIPLYASAGTGPGGLPPPTATISPGSGAPSLPADSVWRPW